MSIKAIAAGTYSVSKFFVPTLGEIKNWNLRKEYLLNHWKNQFSFILYETENDTFIKIDNPISNYTPLATPVVVMTQSKIWCKKSGLIELTTEENADWMRMLAAAGIDATTAQESVYLSKSKEIEQKFNKAKKAFYDKYGDYPIYTTKKEYEKTSA